MKSTRKQNGHAAMIVAMIVPALWVLMSLGTDGARALQDKARMDDALEAATLAVAAHNDDNEQDYEKDAKGNDTSTFDSSIAVGSGSNANKQIAKAYLTQYMTDMSSIASIDIVKEDCEEIAECVAGLANGEQRFFQYTITATTNHDTWLENDTTFGDSFEVSSDGTSRKYQSSGVDVVFVSDFSGSMSNSWNGTKKYLGLISTIEAVTNELSIYNSYSYMDKSTVSFVGFNEYVYSLVSTSDYTGYSKIKYCSKNYRTDNNMSITEIFDTDPSCISGTSKTATLYSGNYNSTSRYFFDISPTNGYNSSTGKYDFSDFNGVLGEFYPGGYTASHQGLLRGAQLVEKGTNVNRLIIILSDGQDYPYYWNKYRTIKLVNNGLCDNIRSHLDSLEVDPDGDEKFEKVSSKIALIGFDYSVSTNTGLTNCVDDIYEAKNQSDILNRILELISEEIGHLK